MTQTPERKAAIEAMSEGFLHAHPHQMLPQRMCAALSALLTALPTLGWQLVPVVATKKMTDRAHSALYKWREKQGDPQGDPTNPEKHGIRYAAMIAAAPKFGGPDAG